MPVMPTLERARRLEREARGRTLRVEVRHAWILAILGARWIDANVRTVVTWAMFLTFAYMVARAAGAI